MTRYQRGLAAVMGFAGALAAAVPAMAGPAVSRPLAFEQWFKGRSTATGVFRSAIGGPDRRVSAKFVGQWDGRFLTLTEDIAYSDGEKAHKVWHLEKTGPGTYTGRRDDLIGVAKGYTDDQGRIHLQYTATTGGRNLTFDDILQRNPDDTVLNTTRVTYYFIHVGDVELHFRRGR